MQRVSWEHMDALCRGKRRWETSSQSSVLCIIGTFADPVTGCTPSLARKEDKLDAYAWMARRSGS